MHITIVYVCIYILKKSPKRINVTSNTRTQHTLYIRDVNMFSMLFIYLFIFYFDIDIDFKNEQ